jgi:hypothetical protein
MTMDEGVPGAGATPEAGPSTAGFTREELDAAEPAGTTARSRWLIGLGIGALGTLWIWPIGLLFLLCLPFALTAAGAGALLGAGAVFVALSAFDLAVWLNGDSVDPALLAASAIAGVVALVAGVLGTAVLARRARARAR